MSNKPTINQIKAKLDMLNDQGIIRAKLGELGFDQDKPEPEQLGQAINAVIADLGLGDNVQVNVGSFGDYLDQVASGQAAIPAGSLEDMDFSDLGERLKQAVDMKASAQRIAGGFLPGSISDLLRGALMDGHPGSLLGKTLIESAAHEAVCETTKKRPAPDSAMYPNAVKGALVDDRKEHHEHVYFTVDQEGKTATLISNPIFVTGVNAGDVLEVHYIERVDEWAAYNHKIRGFGGCHTLHLSFVFPDKDQDEALHAAAIDEANALIDLIEREFNLPCDTRYLLEDMPIAAFTIPPYHDLTLLYDLIDQTDLISGYKIQH